MLRRPIIRVSSCHHLIGKLRRRVRYEQGTQLSHFSRKECYSSSPEKEIHGASGTAKPSAGGKFMLTSVLIAGGGLWAYQSGFIDNILVKKETTPVGHENSDVSHTQLQSIEVVGSSTMVANTPRVNEEEKHVADEIESVVNDRPHVIFAETIDTKSQTSDGAEKEIQRFPEVELKSDTDETDPGVSVTLDDASLVKEAHDPNEVALQETTDSMDYNSGAQISHVNVLPDELPTEMVAPTQPASGPVSTDDREEAQGLIEKYLLNEMAELTTSSHPEEESLVYSEGDNSNGDANGDRNVIIDLLQAIHVAEERQARLDALAFAEEKRALKEKYEKELRELRARELMRAEEVAMLDKEIKREKAKAASAIVSLHEKMEEKLRIELEQKESETEAKLKVVQELAKAELTAAIAREKAARIEELDDANLNISALCMAFFARSEETRQIHSIHKLALGALAVEDALAKGLPIKLELDSLNTYMQGIEKDSLIHLVLSSLPEETRNHGTDTLLQLNRKFNAMKNNLRQQILVPAGGGLVAYALAQMASWLRLKNVDPQGNGIESIICRVDNLLAEGKVMEAANALQEGVKGSQAEQIVGDWVRCARNRAIAEQALTVLQSYATSVSLAH